MRNHWKISAKGLVASLAFLAASQFSVGGFAASKDDENLEDLSFIEMVNSVDLGDQSNFIQNFQDKEAKKVLIGTYNKIDGCSVETYRNKEVLLVTIPTRYLFAPNETELNENAGNYLAPLKRYLRIPDTYRVLLVVHTDNTGSEAYRDALTEDRADAIYYWFEDQGCDTSFLFPYALGDDMPLFNNDSQKNRDANRRLEVYLVPGKKMLNQAKKGKIEF